MGQKSFWNYYSNGKQYVQGQAGKPWQHEDGGIVTYYRDSEPKVPLMKVNNSLHIYDPIPKVCVIFAWPVVEHVTQQGTTYTKVKYVVENKYYKARHSYAYAAQDVHGQWYPSPQEMEVTGATASIPQYYLMVVMVGQNALDLGYQKSTTARAVTNKTAVYAYIGKTEQGGTTEWTKITGKISYSAVRDWQRQVDYKKNGYGAVSGQGTWDGNDFYVDNLYSWQRHAINRYNKTLVSGQDHIQDYIQLYPQTIVTNSTTSSTSYVLAFTQGQQQPSSLEVVKKRCLIARYHPTVNKFTSSSTTLRVVPKDYCVQYDDNSSYTSVRYLDPQQNVSQYLQSMTWKGQSGTYWRGNSAKPSVLILGSSTKQCELLIPNTDVLDWQIPSDILYPDSPTVQIKLEGNVQIKGESSTYTQWTISGGPKEGQKTTTATPYKKSSKQLTMTVKEAIAYCMNNYGELPYDVRALQGGRLAYREGQNIKTFYKAIQDLSDSFYNSYVNVCYALGDLRVDWDTSDFVWGYQQWNGQKLNQWIQCPVGKAWKRSAEEFYSIVAYNSQRSVCCQIYSDSYQVKPLQQIHSPNYVFPRAGYRSSARGLDKLRYFQGIPYYYFTQATQARRVNPPEESLPAATEGTRQVILLKCQLLVSSYKSVQDVLYKVISANAWTIPVNIYLPSSSVLMSPERPVSSLCFYKLSYDKEGGYWDPDKYYYTNAPEDYKQILPQQNPQAKYYFPNYIYKVYKDFASAQDIAKIPDISLSGELYFSGSPVSLRVKELYCRDIAGKPIAGKQKVLVAQKPFSASWYWNQQAHCQPYPQPGYYDSLNAGIAATISFYFPADNARKTGGMWWNGLWCEITDIQVSGSGRIWDSTKQNPSYHQVTLTGIYSSNLYAGTSAQLFLSASFTAQGDVSSRSNWLGFSSQLGGANPSFRPTGYSANTFKQLWQAKSCAILKQAIQTVVSGLPKSFTYPPTTMPSSGSAENKYWSLPYAQWISI